MDTNELKSFIIAARCGSFQKAAEQLFLSSTALIKQINGLENELGGKLFVRTNRGIFLTESGKYFLDFSQNMLRQCDEAVQNVRSRSIQKAEPIRFGFSPINPYQHVFERCYYTSDFHKRFSMIMIQISGEFKDFMDEMKNLGSHVDTIPYFLGNRILEPLVREFCLARIPMCVAMPLDHPLADKKVICFDDLNDQTLFTLADSVNSCYKFFNKRIRESAPNVRFSPISFIDFPVLNETVALGNLLLAGGHLWNVHPLLRFVPLEEELLLPYGLYYANNPSEGIIKFLQAFQENGISGNPEDAPVISFRE